MSNENKKTALPKLRFPEFQGAEEWEEKPLGEIMTVTSCRRVHESDWTNEGVPFFRAREIVALRKNEKISPLFISEDLYQKNIKLSGEIKAGDLLVTGVGTIGISYLVKDGDRFYFKDGNIIWFQNSGEEVIGDFLFWLYESDYIKKQITRMAGVGTVGTYTIDNAKRTLIPLPSKEEQQAIANAFSTLNDSLTAQIAKLEALKSHKRGLMQALFPAEGETVPKLRFPEFQDAEEWEEKKLGKLIEIKGRIGYRGYTVEDIVEEGEGAISLSPSNINDEGNLTFGKATFISWEKYNESPEIMLQDGFTVLVKTGSSYGKAAFVKNLPEKTTINPQVVVLKPIHINSVFLFLLVCNTAIQTQIEAHVVGGAIPTLSQGSMMQFDIQIPSLAEQQKIADCLTSLDNSITAQIQKIEALKLHKKGLMQHLFPAAAEPTA